MNLPKIAEPENVQSSCVMNDRASHILLIFRDSPAFITLLYISSNNITRWLNMEPILHGRFTLQRTWRSLWSTEGSAESKFSLNLTPLLMLVSLRVESAKNVYNFRIFQSSAMILLWMTGNGWEWGPSQNMGNLAVCVNKEPWAEVGRKENIIPFCFYFPIFNIYQLNYCFNYFI